MGESSFVIGIPIYENANLLDLAGPYQVFKTPIWSPSVKLVAASNAPVRTVEGASLIPDTTFEACPPLDLLFVPGGPGQCDMMTDDAYMGFLARQGQSAKCVASVCVGALLLGAAGLLDGCKATTHWAAIAALELFPEIEVAPGCPRFVIDRKGDRLRVTGGGMSAGMDEALEIVRIYAGDEKAKSVQLLLQYAPKPPFEDGDPASASPQVYDTVWRATRPLERKRIAQIQRMLSRQPRSR